MMSPVPTIQARDGATLVPFSSTEMSRLIRASEGRVVPARFGTGGAALIANEAAWALPLLADWRGLSFSNGAGI
jgi:hypothetical protein